MLSHAIEVLGWTLLHFVWQGAVVGVLAAAMLLVLRRRSANARYLIAVSALGLMLLLPLGTIAWIEQTPPVGEVSPIFNTVSTIEIPRTRDDGTLALDEPPIKAERIGIDWENPPPADAVPLIPVSDTGKTILEDLAEQRSAFGVESFLKPFIPWAVTVWLIGVGVLSLRLFASWLSVLRLRRRATQPASADWQAMLGRLAERLRVNRPVKLVESALVEVPAVIGWLRPVILLPASAMTGLTTEQLEALLAHELAHVRRHDYLINLLQTVVETLLFYHPAVWWVSHRIRIERERCCDALAVKACGDGLMYAKALVALEELRAPVSKLALGAADGSLSDRIQRVIALPSNQRSAASSQFAVVAGCLAIGLVTIFLTQSPRGQGTNPPKSEPMTSDRVIISGAVITAENEPVADAEVFLPFELSNGIPDKEHCEVTRSDEKGRYRFDVSSREFFDNAKEGYSFLVWALRPGTGMGISIVERPKSENRDSVCNIQLRPGRPFAVRVFDPEGQPVADAEIRPSGMETPTDQYPVPTSFSKRMTVRTNSEGLAEMTEISPMNWFVLRADTKLFGTQALYFSDPQPKELGELVYKLKRTARIKGTISSAPSSKNRSSGYLVTRWSEMQERFPPGVRKLMVGSSNIRIDKLANSDGTFDLLVPEGIYQFEHYHRFKVQPGTTTTLRVDGDKVEIELPPARKVSEGAEPEENDAAQSDENDPEMKRILARCIREAAAALASGRLELALEQEHFLKPGADKPDGEIATSTATSRWIGEGPKWRVDYDGRMLRSVENRFVNEWLPLQWTAGFDGQQHYHWDRANKQIELGREFAMALQHSPARLFFGFTVADFEMLLAAPKTKMSEITHQDLQCIQVDAELVVQSKTQRFVFILCPEHGYLPLENRFYSDGQFVGETKFSDFYEPRAGVWAARKIRIKSADPENPNMEKPLERITHTVKRLDLGETAKLQADEFRVDPPAGTRSIEHTKSGNQQPETKQIALPDAPKGANANDTSLPFSDNGEVRPVVSIALEGNRSVKAEDVLKLITIKLGEPPVLESVVTATKAIYRTQRFYVVEPRYRVVDKGIEIVFRVVERPSHAVTLTNGVRVELLGVSNLPSQNLDAAFAKSSLEVAKKGLAKLFESNRKVPQSIPAGEIQRAQLIVERAEAALQLAEAGASPSVELQVKWAKACHAVARAEVARMRDANRRVPNTVPESEIEKAESLVRHQDNLVMSIEDGSTRVDMSRDQDLRGWWLANGSSLPKSPLTSRSLQSVVPAGAEKDSRAFALKISTIGEEPSVSVRYEPAAPNSALATIWLPRATGSNEPRQAIVELLAGPWPEQKTVKLIAHIALGKWQGPWAFGMEQKGLETIRGVPGNVLALVKQIAPQQLEVEQGNGVLICWPRLPADIADRADIRMVAIDKRGIEHSLTGTKARRNPETGRVEQGTYFKLAKADIDHFAFGLRPFEETVTFENVSLEPGYMTQSHVSSRNPAASVKLALSGSTELAFADSPFIDVLTFLRDFHNIPIHVDSTAYERHKELDDVPVTLTVTKTTLASALSLLLKPLQLSYCVESDRLIIATPEEVKRRGHSLPTKGDSSAKIQGAVLWVKQDNGLVGISLGEGDGIQTRTKFKVRRHSRPNDPSSPTVEKGTIEIIRVIDRQTAEARILGLIQNDGPAKGDEVVPIDETNEPAPAAQLKGQIRWIDKSKGMVWINLGQTDGVARPMRFQVREKADPKNGNQPQAVKGKIEVSRVIDGHTSEARIIQDNQNNAVAKGDEIVQLVETTQPNDKPNEEERKLPPPKGEINDAARPGTDRLKPKQGSVSGAISGKRRERDSEMLDQFTGRVRLKTEKPLPDLEKVIVPAGKVLDESLVFSKDGGLANVVVYLPKPTFPIEPPPSDKSPKPFVLIAEGERFWPHVAFVRVGRPVVFENRKTDQVNFRMAPLKNVSFNVLVKVEDHVNTQAFRHPENIPFSIKSDIQPWMQSYVLTLDHPFAAVTDEEGRFTINGLPPGDHEFRVWHERSGYLEKKLPVTIKVGENLQSDLEFTPDRFQLTEADVMAWRDRLIDATRVPRGLAPRPAVKQPKADDAQAVLPQGANESLPNDSGERGGVSPPVSSKSDAESTPNNRGADAAPLAKLVEPDDQPRRKLIERGIEFLKAKQQENGTWQGQPLDGVTALAAAALLQAGVKADDPVIQKALVHLRKVEPALSYTVALQTMVFCWASPKEDAELIRRNVAWLEKAQVPDGKSRGAWSYPANPNGRGDGSCSRFAMLGLDAAKRAGFEVKEETWRRASDYWLTNQKENGGWGYTAESPPTLSMTLSGVAGLATANRHLPDEEQRKVRDAAIRKPAQFIEKSMSGLPNATFVFYVLHSLERAGHLTGNARFGELDWKSDTTKRLLETQQPDGSWKGANAAEESLIATSFALLVLSGQPELKQNARAEAEASTTGRFVGRVQLKSEKP